LLKGGEIVAEMTRRQKEALDKWITKEPDFDDDDEPLDDDPDDDKGGDDDDPDDTY
jgi:hypothetical protein